MYENNGKLHVGAMASLGHLWKWVARAAKTCPGYVARPYTTPQRSSQNIPSVENTAANINHKNHFNSNKFCFHLNKSYKCKITFNKVLDEK